VDADAYVEVAALDDATLVSSRIRVDKWDGECRSEPNSGDDAEAGHAYQVCRSRAESVGWHAPGEGPLTGVTGAG
jgi:hypothetical protein